MPSLSLAYKIILIIGGLTGGFVDSIAGGGGLISLPLITLLLGPGPTAIGTNKIAGLASTLVALLVYMKGGHVQWRRSFAFTVLVGVGSLAGTMVSPLIPLAFFRWLLLGTCPVILWIVWRRDLWVNLKTHNTGDTGEVGGGGPAKITFAQKYDIPFLVGTRGRNFYVPQSAFRCTHATSSVAGHGETGQSDLLCGGLGQLFSPRLRLVASGTFAGRRNGSGSLLWRPPRQPQCRWTGARRPRGRGGASFD